MTQRIINRNVNGDLKQINTPQIINQYPIIGIDLSVSYWTASILQDGKIYIIPISGKNHLPAFIACINNEFKFGDEAKEMFYDNRDVTIFDLWYILGLRFNSGRELEEHMNNYSYAICNSGDKPKICLPNNKKTEISIEKLCDIIINNLLYATEIHLNTTVHNIVVAIPVYFQEPQKTALLRATSHVGIIDLVFEPIAAAYAYKISERYIQDKIYNFLVYNLQEDNLDVSVVEYSNKIFKIRANIYVRHLKNNYTFRYLDELCTQTYEKYYLSNPRFHPLNSGTLRFYSKTIFHDILDADCFKIELDTIQDEKITRCISRVELDELLLILVKESLLCVENVLREANLHKNDVNEVLFVGKITKHNIVRQELKHFFGSRKCLNCSLNPEEVLAIGAAIRAAILQQEFYSNSKITDETQTFCSHSNRQTKSTEAPKLKLHQTSSLKRRKANLSLHEKMLSMCTLFTNVVSRSNLKMCVKEKLLFVPAYLKSKLRRQSRKLKNGIERKQEIIFKKRKNCDLNDVKFLSQMPRRTLKASKLELTKCPDFLETTGTEDTAISEAEAEEINLESFVDVINCIKDNLDMYYVTVCFVVFLLHWASENICINIAIALISIAVTLILNNRTVRRLDEI